MTPCHVVQITTPKKYLLNGLWWGPKRPKRVIVWVHGLGGSAFSMRTMVQAFVGKDTAVLTFNNRGFEAITTLRNVSERKSQRFGGGAAHEVFAECVDDIEGAVTFAHGMGAKHIFLAGHSTGCQKSIYWAYKKKAAGVKGVILLAPISDWAAETMRQGTQKIARALGVAHRLVLNGKPHELLPAHLWHEVMDAQRFLSLYSPDSPEELFSYSQPEKQPKVLQSVRIPVAVFWAGKDEYADQPAQKIAAWFEATIHAPHRVVIVAGVGHGFKGQEERVVKEARAFMKECGR